jgi:hypothetical protein
VTKVCYFSPDYSLPSGGVRTLYRHVLQLNRRQRPAVVVHTRSGFRTSWHGIDVPVVWLEDRARFEPDDVLVFPAGAVTLMRDSARWPNPRIVAALAWSSIYEQLPPDCDWTDFGIRHVLSPSPTIARFVEHSMRLPVTLIPEVVDIHRYRNRPELKEDRICFAPRKSAVGAILQRICTRLGSAAGRYHWVPLLDLAESDYAAELARARIFLATNSREGANVSVLEAMAAGCIVVGFSGVGGNDFMRGAGSRPNCVLVENENLPQFRERLEEVVARLAADATAFDDLIAAAVETAAAYAGLDAEADALVRFYDELRGADIPTGAMQSPS